VTFPGPRTLYLGFSEEGNFDPRTSQLASIIRANKPAGLRWTYVPRSDLTHATIFRALKPAALIDALH
jgi:hypothetical protein